MFIVSIRAARAKALGLGVLCLVLILLLGALLPLGEGVYAGDALTNVMNADPKSFQNVTDAQARISFLSRYGWEVEEQPAQIAEVTVPNRFDAVYEKYNQVQKAEGLDLNGYRGKSAKRYTYVVTNYDYDGTVYANLLIYKDRVIAADICSADIGGFMHGLTKENRFIL